MKKVLLLLLLQLTIMSCSSESAPAEQPQPISQLSANINNVIWTPTIIKKAKLSKYSMGNQKLFEIIAENDAQLLELNMFSNYTADDSMPYTTFTYQNTSNPVNGFGFVQIDYRINGNYIGEHNATSSTITITSINPTTKTISGTFSAVLNKTGILQNVIVTPQVLTITNGTFTNINYTVENF